MKLSDAMKIENDGHAYSCHIESKLFVYREAMTSAGYDRLIIGSGSQEFKFCDDLFVPYSANSYFAEFAPLNQHPNNYLLIEVNQNKPVLHIQVHDDFWHTKPEPLADEFAVQFDIKEYVEQPELKAAPNTAFIGPDLANLCSSLSERIDLNPKPLLNYVDFHRAWKTEHELQCMRMASRLSVPAHRAAEQAFYACGSEYDIHMAYVTSLGCREHELPYDNVIALNENAAVLHHMHLATKKPDRHLSFLIDAGARYLGYGSDISRTYYCHDALPEFVALVEGIEQLQLRLVQRVQPGTEYLDIHESAHSQIADLLVQLGLLNCSAEQALSSGLTSAFFPHGIGHLIGIQVHDKGGHMLSADGSLKLRPAGHTSLRLNRMLEENMVVTIEPGVYFIESLLAPWQEKGLINKPLLEALMPYGGVRIEDNVIAKKSGVENLTRESFKNY